MDVTPPRGGGLRAWLEYIAQFAIDWLDELDAADEDREPEDEGPLEGGAA